MYEGSCDVHYKISQPGTEFWSARRLWRLFSKGSLLLCRLFGMCEAPGVYDILFPPFVMNAEV